jgi:hypothetical protein
MCGEQRRRNLAASIEDEWKSALAACKDQRPAELTGQHWFAGAGISGSNSRICADLRQSAWSNQLPA